MSITTLTEIGEPLSLNVENLFTDIGTPEQREEFRTTKLFRNSNDVWGSRVYNSSKKIGSVMSAIRNLPNDAELEDWEDYYLTNVRTPEQVFRLVDEFAYENEYYFEDAAMIWWSRVIDQTFAGWHGEILVMEALMKHFDTKYDVREATDEEDRKYGVDLVISKGNRVQMGIQVKKASYFHGYNAQLKLERETINPKKNQKFTDENSGAPVFYVTIESIEAGDFHFIKAEDCHLGRKALQRA